MTCGEHHFREGDAEKGLKGKGKNEVEKEVGTLYEKVEPALGSPLQPLH